MIKNIGNLKHFPGGPECTYRGKKIPCMCAWSPKGSMTSEILKTILEILDTLEVFDRSNNVTPTLLLFGHGS